MPNSSSKSTRYKRVYLGPYTLNVAHLRNPWVIACWSIFFPGYGHVKMGRYLIGWILILWEITINTATKLNTAILYSLTGQFDKAIAVLNKEWLLLYVPVYVYCIWDGWRSTVDVNEYVRLAEIEDPAIPIFKMGGLDYNFLDKRHPGIAVVWSLFMPGLGQMYNHRLPSAIFLLTWWIVVSYLSHLLTGIHYTLLGEFRLATASLDPQWLLFLPSAYGFAMYDAYVDSVEFGKAYEKQLAKFLRENYQDPSFEMPFSK